MSVSHVRSEERGRTSCVGALGCVVAVLLAYFAQPHFTVQVSVEVNPVWAQRLGIATHAKPADAIYAPPWEVSSADTPAVDTEPAPVSSNETPRPARGWVAPSAVAVEWPFAGDQASDAVLVGHSFPLQLMVGAGAVTQLVGRRACACVWFPDQSAAPACAELDVGREARAAAKLVHLRPPGIDVNAGVAWASSFGSGDSCHTLLAALIAAEAGAPSAVHRLSVTLLATGRRDVLEGKHVDMVLDYDAVAGPDTRMLPQVTVSSPCDGCVKPPTHTLHIEAHIQLHPACVVAARAALSSQLPCVVAQDDWHHMCFFLPSVNATTTTGHPPVTSGPLLGCTNPGVRDATVSGFGLGHHAIAVVAKRSDGSAASNVGLARWLVTDDASVLAAAKPPMQAGSPVDAGSVVEIQHGEQLAAGFFERLQQDALATAPRDLRFSGVAEWGVPSCPHKFMVLLLGLPSPENNNLVVFEHIARTVHHGLVELGVDATLAVCADLRRCGGAALAERLVAEDGTRRRVIIVGSNAVHLFLPTHKSEAPTIATRLLPPDAVLYNFEYVVPRAQTGEHAHSWVDDDFIRMHQQFTAWDYSESNVHTWRRDYGVNATLARVGYAPGVMDATARVPEDKKDIDVLFFGTHTQYRKPILKAVKQGGFKFVDGAGFGQELYDLVARARIVLNLRSFGNNDEFKMSRFMVLFANSAFVVSEDTGTAEDVAPYRAGMVVVPSTNLVEVLQYYLDRPLLRQAIADEGHRLFKERSAGRELEDAVAMLAANAGCHS